MARPLNCIIPAKTSSTRVLRKNWREFANGQSLVELTIEKLIRAGISVENIYVSCEDEEVAGPVCDKYGTILLVRPAHLCSNDAKIGVWMRTTIEQVYKNKDFDVAWCQVCDPLFNSYEYCFDVWEEIKTNFDSLVVCYERKFYLLDDHSRPIKWSFGNHHTKSQDLPVWRLMPFTLSIFPSGYMPDYYIGHRPYWFVAENQHVDIDTEEDFELAQIIYERLKDGHRF